MLTHMNAMIVKLTWTLSGGGTCVPPLVTVTGLNDRGLPSGDMLVVRVAGLCIGGSGVGANQQEGNIMSPEVLKIKNDLNFIKECPLTIHQLPQKRYIPTSISLMKFQCRMN